MSEKKVYASTMEEVVVLSPEHPIHMQVMKDLAGEPFEGVDSEPVPFKDEIVLEKDLWRYKSMSYGYSPHTGSTFGTSYGTSYGSYGSYGSTSYSSATYHRKTRSSHHDYTLTSYGGKSYDTHHGSSDTSFTYHHNPHLRRESKVADKPKGTTVADVEMDDLYEKMRSNIDENGNLMFTPPITARPDCKGSIQDLLWLGKFCRSVAPIGGDLNVSSEGRLMTITYPKLHKKQIRFLVNRIILRKKIDMIDTAWFFSRESLRQARKTIMYCIQDGKIIETIDQKPITINVVDLLEFITEIWIHLQENIDDLWLTGTGNPDPEEDHATYLDKKAEKYKEAIKKKEIEEKRKRAEYENKMFSQDSEQMFLNQRRETIVRKNSQAFLNKQKHNMYC